MDGSYHVHRLFLLSNRVETSCIGGVPLDGAVVLMKDHYFLDQKGLTSFGDGSKYRVRPLDRPGATKQLREP